MGRVGSPMLHLQGGRTVHTLRHLRLRRLLEDVRMYCGLYGVHMEHVRVVRAYVGSGAW